MVAWLPVIQEKMKDKIETGKKDHKIIFIFANSLAWPKKKKKFKVKKIKIQKVTKSKKRKMKFVTMMLTQSVLAGLIEGTRFSLEPTKFNLTTGGGYHEMPNKVCGRYILHVMAYAFFSEMPQNRTVSVFLFVLLEIWSRAFFRNAPLFYARFFWNVPFSNHLKHSKQYLFENGAFQKNRA